MGLSHLWIPHRGERDRERAVGVATPAPSQAQGEGRELRGARQSEWGVSDRNARQGMPKISSHVEIGAHLFSVRDPYDV